MLIINSDFGLSRTAFDILTHKAKNSSSLPPHPCLTHTHPLRNLPEFPDETYAAKTRGMGPLYGEYCIIFNNRF